MALRTFLHNFSNFQGIQCPVTSVSAQSRYNCCENPKNLLRQQTLDPHDVHVNLSLTLLTIVLPQPVSIALIAMERPPAAPDLQLCFRKNYFNDPISSVI